MDWTRKFVPNKHLGISKMKQWHKSIIFQGNIWSLAVPQHFYLWDIELFIIFSVFYYQSHPLSLMFVSRGNVLTNFNFISSRLNFSYFVYTCRSRWLTSFCHARRALLQKMLRNTFDFWARFAFHNFDIDINLTTTKFQFVELETKKNFQFACSKAIL